MTSIGIICETICSNIYAIRECIVDPTKSKWEIVGGHSLLLIGKESGFYKFKDSYDNNLDDAQNKFIKKIKVDHKTANLVLATDPKLPDSSYTKNDYFIYDYGYALKFVRK